jgi:hypothetical protein
LKSIDKSWALRDFIVKKEYENRVTTTISGEKNQSRATIPVSLYSIPEKEIG